MRASKKTVSREMLDSYVGSRWLFRLVCSVHAIPRKRYLWSRKRIDSMTPVRVDSGVGIDVIATDMLVSFINHMHPPLQPWRRLRNTAGEEIAMAEFFAVSAYRVVEAS